MDRRGFIGASEAHHVFNAPPFGCSRYLYLNKRGVTPDYPFYGNKDTERGKGMEDIIAKIYSETTGRKVRRARHTYTHEKYPFMGGHIDRHLTGGGILEIKCPAQRGFGIIKREGLPDAYILQMQFYLMITRKKWGAFAIFWADGWELLHFDVERDDDLIAKIEEECITFWEFLKDDDYPYRLHHTDRRCQNCPYRIRCQQEYVYKDLDHETPAEVAEDTKLDTILSEYQEVKDMYDEACAIFDLHKQRVKDYLADKTAVKTPRAVIHYRPVQTERLNTGKLKAEYPDIYEACKVVTTHRPLKVFLM